MANCSCHDTTICVAFVWCFNRLQPAVTNSGLHHAPVVTRVTCLQPRRTLLQGLGLSAAASQSDLQKLASERSGGAHVAGGNEGMNVVGAPRQVVSTGGEFADRRASTAHRRAQSWSLFRVRHDLLVLSSARCTQLHMHRRSSVLWAGTLCIAHCQRALLHAARAGEHEPRAQREDACVYEQGSGPQGRRLGQWGRALPHECCYGRLLWHVFCRGRQGGRDAAATRSAPSPRGCSACAVLSRPGLLCSFALAGPLLAQACGWCTMARAWP